MMPHMPPYEGSHLVFACFEEDVSLWRATYPLLEVLLDHCTLSHAIDEDVPHRRRFQTLDLGFHCIF
jgi:hypothetical protein